MNYLFFDIECSDGRNMCSFGYVLTDGEFSIKEKRDILINPESYFHTGAWGKKNREKDPGIELAYPEKTFRRSPKFDYYYNEIRDLITAPERIVIGFSHINDANYISHACARYKLPSINYKFYDVQNVYRDFKGEKQQVSLEGVLAEFGVDISGYVPHKSDDDAEVSMLAAKSLCEKAGVGAEELFSLYPYCVGELYEYTTTIAKKPKPVKEGCPPKSGTGNSMRGKNRRAFLDLVAAAKPSEKDNLILSGKKVCFSINYESRHFREMLKFVGLIADLGGRYTVMASDADYFVKDPMGARCSRIKHAKYAAESGRDVRILSFAEFLELIGAKAEDFPTAPDALPKENPN